MKSFFHKICSLYKFQALNVDISLISPSTKTSKHQKNKIKQPQNILYNTIFQRKIPKHRIFQRKISTQNPQNIISTQNSKIFKIHNISHKNNSQNISKQLPLKLHAITRLTPLSKYK